MTWPVILKDGPDRNQTLATIKFDTFGNNTNQQIFICKEWAEGLTWAKQQGHTWALFVKSGTMITDWAQWKQLVDHYPHNGLIAHLIWHPGQQLYLDDQCWFMNINNFEGEVTIFDALGRAVVFAEINATQNQIAVSELVAGVYFVAINGQTIRFVKR
jgi:hypothetical protein